MAVSSALDRVLSGHHERSARLQNDLRTDVSEVAEVFYHLEKRHRCDQAELRQNMEAVEEIETLRHRRWVERLSRMHEWKGIAQRALQGWTQSQPHLMRARREKSIQRIRERLQHHAERRALKLSAKHVALEFRLVEWLSLLNDHAKDLNGLKYKMQTRASLFVSRARKLPEVRFLNEQTKESQELGHFLKGLRQSITHGLSRLRRARIHVADLEIERLVQRYLKLHDQAMSDTLIYQQAFSELHKLQRDVASLRCLEDLAQPRSRFSLWIHRLLASRA